MLEYLLLNPPLPPTPSKKGVLRLRVTAGSQFNLGTSITSLIGKVVLQNGAILPYDVSTGSAVKTFTIPPEAGIIELHLESTKVGSIIEFSGSSPRIAEVTDWSTVPALVQFTLYGFSNLTKVPETCPAQTSLKNFFTSCSAFNQDISMWETGHVTDMSSMFLLCSAFNQPLNNWDVQNVTSMDRMLALCLAFNQPLDLWDTKSLVNAGYMFSGDKVFNKDISNWNVSKVQDISSFLNNCSVFNQNLSSMVFKSTVTRTGYDSGATAWNAAYRPKFTG